VLAAPFISPSPETIIAPRGTGTYCTDMDAIICGAGMIAWALPELQIPAAQGRRGMHASL
jgi:hypothetical protein